MPLKRNHSSKERYPYVSAGTLESMRIEEILTKNSSNFFAVSQRFRIRVPKAHRDIIFCKVCKNDHSC